MASTLPTESPAACRVPAASADRCLAPDDGLAGFIATRYHHAAKIVEVGTGNTADLAVRLAGDLGRTAVVFIDEDGSRMGLHRSRGVRAYVDNLWAPRLPLYTGAALVYARRPPSELVPPLERLAARVEADLLVTVRRGDEARVATGVRWVPVVMEGSERGALRTCAPVAPRLDAGRT